MAVKKEISLPRDATTEQGQAAAVAAPTNKNMIPQQLVVVKCNIDKISYASKPVSEYGAIRNRLGTNATRTLDAQRLFRGILKGHTFTPAAMSGKGGDSWQEQKLFAVDIDNADTEQPLTVEQAQEIMKQAGISPLFAYHTFSNSESVPRFRIVFATDETVVDKADAEHITEGLQSLFPGADLSCKDAARMLLGTNQGAAIDYTGQTNPVSRLLEIYHQQAEPEQTAVSPALHFPQESDLARAIHEFDMGGYVAMSEGAAQHRIGKAVYYNPCPLCGHSDDFHVNGALWYCHGGHGPKTGGNIINFLEERHGLARAAARDMFVHDILGWERRTMQTQKSRKDRTEFAPLEVFEEAVVLPEFPDSALPDELWAMAFALADFAETDIALVAVPALGFCAAAIGRKFKAEAKPGYQEPLNLYALCAAVTGEFKSSVMKPLKRPFDDYQKAWNREHKPLVDDYRNKLKITKQEISAMETQIVKKKASFDDLSVLTARLAQLEANPEKMLCLSVQDCTPEELERLLADNSETMAIISDEGGIMETLTGRRYRDGVNLECLLKAYTGESVQTNRIGRDAVSLEHPCLNINIMCQPVTIQELTANTTFHRRGLCGRFLYAFPQSKAGYRTGDRPPPPVEVVEAYNSLIHDLLSIPPDTDEYGEPVPRIINFSPEAYKEYQKFHDEKEHLLRELEPDDPFRAWVARMHAHAVRLACILHVCEQRDDADKIPLSAETFQRAVRLTRYFKAHAEHAFSLSGASLSESERDALYIWKRIQESGQNQFGKSKLLHLCRRFKEHAENMEPGLNELVTHGYVRIVERRTAGRPAVTVYANPEALKEN